MIRAFVIGQPIAHSRSPAIHGHWLAEHGLAGSYEAIAVEADDLPAFLDRVRAGEFAGGNVTIPHKEAAAGLVDELSPQARRLGAVNTIVALPGGRLRGHNTDAEGYLASLDAEVPGWSGGARRAVVLGAGGAARAVVAALLDRGVPAVLVANRTDEKAESLRQLCPDRVRTLPWAGLHGGLEGADLLVNTTALGMEGQPPLDLDLRRLPEGATVSDIVYVPLETSLLGQARLRNLRTVGGLGMLLHQAVPGFEAWFGVRPRPTAALRRLIEADILARR